MPEIKPVKPLLFGLVKHAKADMERQFARAGIRITPFQYNMLACLKHEPCTLAEVAKKLGIKPPSAVPYLRGLEKQGFIQKRPDPADHRKLMLKITAKGERLFRDIVQGHPADVINVAFKKLSKDKQTQLSKLLQELTDNLTR